MGDTQTDHILNEIKIQLFTMNNILKSIVEELSGIRNEIANKNS